MFYTVDRLIVPSFILHLLDIQVAAEVGQEGFFFFFNTLQLQVETFGIRNSQGHFFIAETQTRLCVLPSWPVLDGKALNGLVQAFTLEMRPQPQGVCSRHTDFPESHPSLPCPYRDGRLRPVRTGLSMLRANVGGAGFWEACLHLTP